MARNSDKRLFAHWQGPVRSVQLAKPKRAKDAARAGRVYIGNTGSYTESVATALRPILGGSISFRGKESSLYYVGDEHGVVAQNKFGQIPVVPLFAIESTLSGFWLAISVRPAGFDRVTYVDHVSIQVYYGDASDPMKTLLFRAEWHPEQGPLVMHGQPHWHAEGTFGRDEIATNPTGFDLQPAIAPGIPLSAFSLVDVHFAMATRFHENRSKCVVGPPVKSDMITNWIKHCVSYIREQLTRRL